MEYSAKPSPSDPTKLDLTYKITEGQRVYVDRVLISGLHYTKPFVVDREMKIHSGEPLNQNEMLESQRRLYDLGIFNAVEMAIQNPEGDATRKNINFQLEEARRYTFNYGVGFEVQTGQPGASTQPQGQPGASGRVSFDVTRLNFRGRDHTITLKTRYGNLQKRALLSYDAPRLFDSEQLTLNFTLTACYFLAGYIDIKLAETYVTENPYALVELGDNPAQSLALRLALLVLMTLCCYGVQVLLERHRRVEEEAREFAVREAQIRSAGRLAAEIAHQIKNPLAIMNTAAYSLQKALREGKGNPGEQIRIIQEEIEKSDRIITEVMGYAQLSEGRVEKLSVTEELDKTMAQVFPPGAGYKVKLHWNYGESFPPLLMQRKHLSETLVNLVQNAREALGERGGNIYIEARCNNDYSIGISIRDDGPGIAPDKLERIFEPYYTTKEKGTGLGLATVKHNVELYGGTVRVESELGKGARFSLIFPAKTLMRLGKP